MSNENIAPGSKVIEAVFAAIDSGDIAGATNHFRNDVTVHFANLAPLVGADAFVGLYQRFTDSLRAVRHEIHDIWSAAETPNVLIARMTAHYTKCDESTVSLPCCNIFGMASDRIADYRVYMDISPALGTAHEGG